MKDQLHPAPATLTRFVLGELPGAESVEIERHLAVCPGCQDRADEAMGLASPFPEGLGSGYDDALDRALLGAAEQLAGLRQETRSAEGLLTELLRESAAGRQRKILDDERFSSLKLCQLLRTHVKEHWFSDPAAARVFAETAVGVAESLDPARYGTILTADARALSWGYLGNSLRIASDFRRAEGAFRQAWSHHRQGTGDIDTESELLLFTSSLRISQGRLDEALRVVDQAISIHRSLCDGHREGSALIQKGLVLAEEGRYSEGIASTRAGLLQIDVSRDPRLSLIAKQNLASQFIDDGDHQEGGRQIDELRGLCRDNGDRVLLAHISWIEGNLAGGLGYFAEAERHLRETLEFFLHLESGSNVFVISLHLAEVHARAGQLRRAREILREVIPLGEAMGVGRPVLAARLLYAQASAK